MHNECKMGIIKGKKMTLKKELKDLNLLDRFLFAEAMEDPEIAACILEIILGKEIVLKHLPQTEKEHRKAAWSRQIRLDVWAMDEADTVYNTEVQKQNTRNLPHRSRLYQGMIDSKLLEPGIIDYNQLNDVYIIMIMPFDLFGKGLYRYTFRMMGAESEGLELEDGATCIFLNTRGTDPGGVSQELIELLRYFEHTSKEVAEQSTSEKIHRMQRKIETIKTNEEVGVKLMNAWEEKILERQEAFAEGVVQGEEKGHWTKLIDLVGRKKAQGQDPEKIAEDLLEDVEQVERIYQCMKEHPQLDAAAIYEKLLGNDASK